MIAPTQSTAAALASHQLCHQPAAAAQPAASGAHTAAIAPRYPGIHRHARRTPCMGTKLAPAAAPVN